MTQPLDGRPPKLDVHMESLKDTLGALNKEVLEGVGVEVGDIGCGPCHALEAKPFFVLGPKPSICSSA